VRMLGSRPFQIAVLRHSRRHPGLADDFHQEAAQAVLIAHPRIAGADDPRAMLWTVAHGACSKLVSRTFHLPPPPLHPPPGPPPPRPRRRALASRARLARRRGRGADPGFLAALREEQAAGPPAPARSPYSSRTLTPGQRAILRAILVGAAGWSRHEVAAEFRRR